MNKHVNRIVALLLLSPSFLLTACSYNPFVRDNNLTGNPAGAVLGAGTAGGGAALLGVSKPFIVGSGLAGGALGYYLTTLRYESGDIMRAGGTVYKIGDYVGMNIPSDQLFESNTADFLPQAEAILNSATAVLARFPNNNILISGNTSGFYREKWEQNLSQRRAQKVAGFFWDAGINNFQDTNNMKMRKLQYTGYGDFFPISNTEHNRGIRQNSRIQINSYPSDYDLHLDQHHAAFFNMGALNEENIINAPANPPCGFKGEC